MACQHILYGSVESRIPLPPEYAPETSSIPILVQPILFQPIVDTFERRILAHECLLGLSGAPPAYAPAYADVPVEAARVRLLAIHSAARQTPRGLYFLDLIPSSIDDPALDMNSTIETIFDSGMKPGNFVFQMVEADLARDPAHSHRIRDYLQRRGFGFALSRAGVGAGACSFQAACDFAPDYINLDRRLIRNFDQPVCAPAIGKLVQIAEKSAARVVAQGVDRGRMVENLWLLGVRLMQGHLFGDASPCIAATLGFAP
jgi:EAL domain-containing protein (putative c-di-GMP-specific phosphodiesterase class I)